MIETMGQVEPDYICLTLSASMKSKDMIEIITNFKDIHIDGIVFTKFDETASSGELLKIPAVSSPHCINDRRTRREEKHTYRYSGTFSETNVTNIIEKR